MAFFGAVNTQPTQISGDIKTFVTSEIASMPGEGSGAYSVPKPWQRQSWGVVLNAVLNNNYTKANDSAANIDYRLIAFTDTTETQNRTYYILENTASNYWGTYIYNPGYSREIIIQSPHPKEDFNTGKEGVHAFHESEAMFFFMAGTNRCANNRPSSCDGISSVCTGQKEAFKISDLAHHDNSLFQDATNTLFHQSSSSYFLQLHGFSKTVSDPYLILSNGTYDSPQEDLLSQLSSNLIAEDNSLTSKIGHIDSPWDRLLGFTYVQGRLINESSDPCDIRNIFTTGRFLHIEQEKTKLRADEAGWNKMANAVINTFSQVVLSVELDFLDAAQFDQYSILISWATLTEVNNDFFELQRSGDGKNWYPIATIAGSGNSTQKQQYFFRDYCVPYNRCYYRLKQVDFDGRFQYSAIRTVAFENRPAIRYYPNPAHAHLFISNTQDVKGVIYLMDTGMRIIKRWVLDGKREQQLSLDDVKPGFYFLKMNVANSLYSMPLVIN